MIKGSTCFPFIDSLIMTISLTSALPSCAQRQEIFPGVSFRGCISIVPLFPIPSSFIEVIFIIWCHCFLGSSGGCCASGSSCGHCFGVKSFNCVIFLGRGLKQAAVWETPPVMQVIVKDVLLSVFSAEDLAGWDYGSKVADDEGCGAEEACTYELLYLAGFWGLSSGKDLHLNPICLYIMI